MVRGVSSGSGVLSSRVVVLVTMVCGVTFFFFNVGLYSDSLCENKVLQREQDLATMANKMLAELRKAELENSNLREQLKLLNDIMKNTNNHGAVDPLQPLQTLRTTTTTSSSSGTVGVLPVVLFAYNRPEYLHQALQSVTSRVPSSEHFPIYVSQDGSVPAVTEVIKSFPTVRHLQHSNRTAPVKKNKEERDTYYYISQHYQFGLSNIFDRLHYDAVIILEDDLEVAPDFFSYFSSLLQLMKKDPSIYCVSAWNDNGQTQFVSDPYALYRSDFFPGLGWLMTKELWSELRDKWPAGYWDDWLREPAQRRGRHCIRPEISRTYTFGQKGSSQGQYYQQFLKNIKLNDVNITWEVQDLSYLHQDNYNVYFNNLMKGAVEITSHNDVSKHSNKDLIIYYTQFPVVAKQFKIMADEKAGIWRGAYNQVVVIKLDSNRIFFAPQSSREAGS